MKQLVTAKTIKPFTGTGGLYVCTTVKNQNELLALCSELGIQMTEGEEIHATVIYAPAPMPIGKDSALQFVDSNHAYADVIGFDVFGPDKVLVALLHSPDLYMRHAKWCALGFHPTYSAYRPHVTVSKNSVSEEGLEILNSKIQCRRGLLRLHLSNEILEDIKHETT